jgi:foldase protein PrsA
MLSRRRAILLASLLAALPISASAQKARSAGSDPASVVAATVNGQVITRGQVADDLLADQVAKLSPRESIYADRQRIAAASVGALVLKRFAASGNTQASVTRGDIIKWLFEDKPPILLEYMENRIREVLIQQEAKKQGVVVTQKEVDARVSDAVKNVREQTRVKATTDADLMAALGYRFATVKRALHTTVILEKLVQKEIEGKIGHPLGQNDWVEARHILVMPDMKPTPDPKNPNAPPLPLTPDEREKRFADARKKIEAILAEIKEGKKTFEAAAQEVNEDATKFKGGSLGIFGRSTMVPEFDKVAFSLKAGVISEPVRTQFGFHLIRVDRAGTEMTAPEREQARKQLLASRSRPFVEELLRNANIRNTLPPPNRGPAAQGE